MITLSGQLAIRTVHGRNGNFNVGRLVTDIGEFVVKDADLDQYKEGKYDGDFLISQISPSYYSTNGRLVVEVRALLGGMTLSGIDTLSHDDAGLITTQEVDPADEINQSPVNAIKMDNPLKDTTPFGVEVSAKSKKPRSDKAKGAQVINQSDAVQSDEALFGILWPLAAVVKLDPTVDRHVFRQQRDRLDKLGYTFDPMSQDWHLKV